MNPRRESRDVRHRHDLPLADQEIELRRLVRCDARRRVRRAVLCERRRTEDEPREQHDDGSERHETSRG